MANLILRPSADQSIKHSRSSGQTAYNLINEATADNDSTYIYQSVSSTSTASVTSTFEMTGFGTDTFIEITAATLYVTARSTKGSSGSAYVFAAAGTNSQSVQMSNTALTSSYATKSVDLANLIEGWNTSLAAGTIPTVLLDIRTSGAKGSGKNNSGFQNRVTQAYISVEYQPVITEVTHNVAVGQQPIGGTASVSSNTIKHNDTVTFTCTVTSANREFYGWYSDSAFTNLVSKDATYVATITDDLTLYPLIGITRHTIVLHPRWLSDVRPYRGNTSEGIHATSLSIPQNINNLANNTVNSTTYAYQSVKQSTQHNYGLGIQIDGTAFAQVPDNATLIDVQANIALAFTSSYFSNVQIYGGEFIYINDNDETPVNKRGSIYSPSAPTSKTTLSLGSDVLGNFTIQEVKNNRIGIQINYTTSSSVGSSDQLRIYGVDFSVTYAEKDNSVACTAYADDHITVSVTSDHVISGQECTWTADVHGGYRFDGWYSDAGYVNLVSDSAIYTTTVSANTTLYAKSKYHSRVVKRELDVPFGKGSTYFIGQDSDGNTLVDGQSGSGWQADFDMSDYGFLATLVGATDVKATAASCNGAEYVSAVINEVGMNILFPNATAHPVMMDTHAKLGRSSITAGRLILTGKSQLDNPINENDWIHAMIDRAPGIRYWRPNNIDAVVYEDFGMRTNALLNATRSSRIEYQMHQYVRSQYRAIGIDDIQLSMYFEEYDFIANNGDSSGAIYEVTTDKAIGYEGDVVTFTAKILPDCTFDGWFDDNNNLVSQQLSYTITPNANITLTAKAHANKPVYTIAAEAKRHIQSAQVVDGYTHMTQGNPVSVAIGAIDGGWTFDGWYNDIALKNLVSEDKIYTFNITQNTVLYAVARKSFYNKQNGKYYTAYRFYKKINGEYVVQKDISIIQNPNIKWIKKN